LIKDQNLRSFLKMAPISFPYRRFLQSCSICYKRFIIILPIILLIGYGILYFRLPFLVGIDQGNILQAAHRIVEGQVPYRDFFHIYSPLSLYLLAGMFKLFGENEQTVRILLTAQGLSFLIILYIISRNVVRGQWLPYLPCFLFAGISYPYNGFYLPHWLSGLLGLIATILILPQRGPNLKEQLSLSSSRAFIIGIIAGLSFLTYQSKGGCIIAGVMIIILLSSLKKWRNVAWTFSGVLFPIMAALALAFYSSALKAAWDDLGIWSVSRYIHLFGYPYYYWWNFKIIALNAHRLFSGLNQAGHYLWYIILTLFIGFQFLIWLPLGILVMLRLKGVHRYALGRVFGMAVAFFLSGMYRPDFTHILQADLLGGVVIVGAVGHLTNLNRKLKRILILLLIIMGGMGLTKEILLPPRQHLALTFRGPVITTPKFLEYAKFLKEHPAGKDKICFLYESQYLYWLLSIENPISWDFILPGYHTETQLYAATEELQKACPRWIILDRSVEWFINPLYSDWPKIDRALLLYNPLKNFISTQYRLISTGDIFRAYERREKTCHAKK